MKKTLWFSGFLCLLAGYLTAQPAGYVPPAEKTETLESGVTKYENLRYGPIPTEQFNDRHSDRIFDLYLPAKAAEGKPLPVFIFVHGGGFRGGEKGGVNATLAAKMAEKGFAALSINYRLRLSYNNPNKESCSKYMKYPAPAPKPFARDLNAAIDDAVEDATKVLEWVRDHADKYGFDTQHVFVGGGSAGAITALYLTYVSGQQALPVKGVLNLWGALEDASVIKPGAPPMLTYHGDRDELIHYDYAVAMKHRMDEIGEKRSVLHIMGGRGHAQYPYIVSDKVPEIVRFFNGLMKEEKK